jgi:hypothetical protein
MPYRRRSGFKKSLVRFGKRMGMALLVLLAVVTAGLLIRSLLSKEKVVSQKAPVVMAVAEIQEPADAGSESAGEYLGLCRKNSINSVQDFRRTVRNDAVLSAHFSGFNWEQAKIGKQDKEIWSFVSYRKGDDIRRTSKPVRLPKGDRYVTDGVTVVRTYCCNDYVVAPPPREVSVLPAAGAVERVDGPARRKQVDLVPEEPLSQQLAAAAAADESAATIPESLRKVPDYAGLPPFYSGPNGPHGPLYVPYTSTKRKHTPNEPPPIVTPEPGTFFLMGGGAALFCLFGLLRRKRTKLH